MLLAGWLCDIVNVAGILDIVLLNIMACILTTSILHQLLCTPGWFHGDFFLRTSSTSESSGEGYVARGIYRYFSHPTIIFGKFWLYALTILCNDADVTAIALLHHALSYLQTIVVEEPHMQRIYQRRIRHSGVMQTLSKLEIIGDDKKGK